MGCKLISLGGGITAIICGGKEDHECDDKGPTIYEFSNGFKGTLLGCCVKEKMYLNYCGEDRLYFLNQKGIHTQSMSVSCSICGRAAIDLIWWM